LPAHVVILRAAIQGVRTSNPPEVAATVRVGVCLCDGDWMRVLSWSVWTSALRKPGAKHLMHPPPIPPKTQALRTLQTIIGNVVSNPHEAKYRQVKRSNATFDRKVGSGAYVLGDR
jgi:hypothetical protein